MRVTGPSKANKKAPDMAVRGYSLCCIECWRRLGLSAVANAAIGEAASGLSRHCLGRSHFEGATHKGKLSIGFDGFNGLSGRSVGCAEVIEFHRSSPDRCVMRKAETLGVKQRADGLATPTTGSELRQPWRVLSKGKLEGLGFE